MISRPEPGNLPPPANAHLKPITENERAWIEFIRLLSSDTDPPPTLARVQQLRSLLS